ncbi:MAG: hypothetical protein Q8N23_18295 [Archangium sp.]|nr:hypothetical protein [Archangium sp.]MDP3572737.1 hypothetical protein [Archangium sp.]
MKSRSLLLLPLLTAAVCFAQAPPRPSAPPKAPSPPMAPMPPLPPLPPMGMGYGGAPGIPAQAAQKAGISSETQKKVRDLSFEANDSLITLEADLKRAQLDLEKTLAQPQVDEPTVMNKLEVVSRAELAVRKNRMGLLVRIRKTVGPESWEKLQAEMPGPDRMMMMLPAGSGGERRELRVIRTAEGGEQVDIIGPE